MRTAIALLLAAAPLLGQDPDTRYHEAYVLEVVEGKAAEAAKAYLDLLRDEQLPAALRAQCRFRFAVTCVLLGRADEARARLAELDADATTPAALRPQVAEYRKALEGMAAGTELDRKLDELVFELGRADVDQAVVPGVYRDFQIIGKAAVPKLRQLLAHPDATLQQHAFRILCRMGEPGMADAWQPEWLHASREIHEYLRTRPEEKARMQERLLAADVGNVTSFPWLPYSAAFQERLAGWVRGGDEELSRSAAAAWAYWAQRERGYAEAFPADLFGTFCDRLSHRPLSDPERRGVEAIAARMEAPALLAAFARAVERGEQWKGQVNQGPLAAGLPWLLADALGGKVGPAEAVAYGKLLLRVESLWKDTGRGRMRSVVAQLDAETAWPLVAPLLAAAHQLLGFRRAEDLPLILKALEAGEPALRQNVLNALTSSLAVQAPDPAYARAVAGALPALVRYWPHNRGLPYAILSSASAEELREIVLAMFRSIRDECPALEGDAIKACFGNRVDSGVIVPSLPHIWELLSADGRQSLLTSAIQFASSNAERPVLNEEATGALEAFVRSHLPDLKSRDAYQILIRWKDRFPPAEWIPYAPEAMWATGSSVYRVPDADGAARALLERPERINRSALRFVCKQASTEVQREVLDRLYAGADAARVHDLLDFTDRWNGGPDTVARALDRLLADEAATLDDLARLGTLVAELRPSEALFPLVERLVTSGRTDTILSGIAIARSIGREELIPKLLALLDSMDPTIRGEAKTAIDSILALRRIKEEVHQRATPAPK